MRAFNKCLIVLLAFLGCIHCTFSQFRKVAGGYAFESKAIIEFTGYSVVGGGVILKGKSRPVKKDSAVIFLGASSENSTDSFTRLTFKTSAGTVTYSNRSGLIKDAISFVKEEKLWTRDVDLLGKPSSLDKVDSLDYPSKDYFYVEMNKQLIGQKTGEQLLLADIILSDPEFYADENAKQLKRDVGYKQVIDSLEASSIKSFYETYVVKNYDSVLKTSKMNLLDSLRYFLISKYLAMVYLEFVEKYYIFSAADWTYNDEFSDYHYAIDGTNHSLQLYGEPVFTFLTLGQKNGLITDYFLRNKSIIKELNKVTFKYVDDFARLSAFFRYLKDKYPDAWNAVIQFSTGIPPEKGNTPRIIARHE